MNIDLNTILYETTKDSFWSGYFKTEEHTLYLLINNTTFLNYQVFNKKESDMLFGDKIFSILYNDGIEKIVVDIHPIKIVGSIFIGQLLLLAGRMRKRNKDIKLICNQELYNILTKLRLNAVYKLEVKNGL